MAKAHHKANELFLSIEDYETLCTMFGPWKVGLIRDDNSGVCPGESWERTQHARRLYDHKMISLKREMESIKQRMDMIQAGRNK